MKTLKLTQNLKQLVYGYNNIIMIESEELASIVNEIESIRNNSKLEGYIFRPNFANSVEFKEYTEEDWYAIYAQWSLSFGWSGIFELITEDNPQTILNDYLKDDIRKPLTPLITEDKSPIVKKTDYIFELIKNLAESKSILTSNQKEIIRNTPIKVLNKVYKKSNFVIKEIRNLFVSILLNKSKDFNPFNDVSSIIPILCENYSIKDSFNIEDNEIINKTILRNVKIKVPTSIKRKVIETLIENYKSDFSINTFKKYQDFWKNILRNVLINNSWDKTIKQYPTFKNVHTLIYSNIKTLRTDIESFKKEGKLEEAFKLEMNNPGNLMRNILFYLRSEKGENYAKKVKKTNLVSTNNNDNFRNSPLGNSFNNKKSNNIYVLSDIKKIIKTKEWKECLLKVNPKLLLQVKDLLNNELYFSPREERLVGKNIKIKYEKPIPSLNKKWVKNVIKNIEKSYKIIKKENNKNLGKIYISDRLKDIALTYTGRLDMDTNTSGKFLPLGSKIKLENLNEDSIFRYGVSWKSPEDNKGLSICIDPSINMINGDLKGKVVNWENPTLNGNNNEILMSSSGDITMCSFDKWSTELVDIDINGMRKLKSTKFYTTIINYNSPEGSLGEVDTHVFFNIIDKKDRVLDGRQIEIPLDKMEYSYKVNDNCQLQIGLMIDLETNEVEILKIAENNVRESSSINSYVNECDELIKNKPQNSFIYDILKKSIKKSQIVDNIKDAEIILDENTDYNILNDIIF